MDAALSMVSAKQYRYI